MVKLYKIIKKMSRFCINWKSVCSDIFFKKRKNIGNLFHFANLKSICIFFSGLWGTSSGVASTLLPGFHQDLQAGCVSQSALRARARNRCLRKWDNVSTTLSGKYATLRYVYLCSGFLFISIYFKSYQINVN